MGENIKNLSTSYIKDGTSNANIFNKIFYIASYQKHVNFPYEINLCKYGSHNFVTREAIVMR